VFIALFAKYQITFFENNIKRKSLNKLLLLLLKFVVIVIPLQRSFGHSSSVDSRWRDDRFV